MTLTYRPETINFHPYLLFIVDKSDMFYVYFTVAKAGFIEKTIRNSLIHRKKLTMIVKRNNKLLLLFIKAIVVQIQAALLT